MLAYSNKIELLINYNTENKHCLKKIMMPKL